jgi:GNAT superfamily N-acetyltransferase
MLSHQEWAGIVGAPDGSELTLLPARLDYGEEVAIEVRHPWIEQFALRRAVRVLSQLVIRNEGLLLRSQFQRRGIGARMLAVQVAAAERLGVARLETEADGRPGSPSRSGYYAWARLGFNGAISHAVKATLPEALRSAADINDLIRMPGGPAWWRQHGHAFEAVFDPKPGSPSLSILAAYTEEKGIQI